MSRVEGELSATLEVLDRLVAFPSVSAAPNLDLVDYVRDYLARLDIQSNLSLDDSGTRANLHAVVGPKVDGGVALNGHTDVVPAEDDGWTDHPFTLVQRDGRLYGRGAVDMKGFLACCIGSAAALAAKPLKRPVHITMCYDEEIGGFGAPVLVADMARTGPRPALAIVGEPTEMSIICGHKGGLELRTEISGLAGHASDPRRGVNAIYFAARFIGRLEEMARELAASPVRGSPFDPPWSTISVGTIEGGVARNVIPGSCAFDWEIRPVPGDDGAAILAQAERYAYEELLPEMRAICPDADIRIETHALVPALDHEQAADAVEFVRGLTGLNDVSVVSFGTDAGHFCRAGISTVVFGPGSIEQAHKPDEFITVDQIAACLAFLDQLGDRLAQ